MGNAFEELTDRAARERWCWSLGCSECGHRRFRDALYALSNDAADTPAAEPSPLGPWPLANQERLIAIGAEANLVRIIDASPHPDWLGYLGLLLYYSADAERQNPRLTPAFRPQLESLMKRGPWDQHAGHSGTPEKLLVWQDMTHFMNARMRRPGRHGGEFPPNTHRGSFNAGGFPGVFGLGGFI